MRLPTKLGREPERRIRSVIEKSIVMISIKQMVTTEPEVHREENITLRRRRLISRSGSTSNFLVKLWTVLEELVCKYWSSLLLLLLLLKGTGETVMLVGGV